MKELELIFYTLVIFISLIVFFLKITAPNYIFELMLKTLGKLAPLFCIFYAGISIFKILNLL